MRNLITCILLLLCSTATAGPPDYLVRIFTGHGPNNKPTVRPVGTGTGVLLSPIYVLTNYHVAKVKDRAAIERAESQLPTVDPVTIPRIGDSWAVMFNDWTVVKARVIKLDPVWDMALLVIDPQERPYLKLGDKNFKGQRLNLQGFGPGVFAECRNIKVDYFFGPDNQVGDIKYDYFRFKGCRPRYGDSGSPLVAHGKLFGLVYSMQFDVSEGNATRVERIRKFLKGTGL